MDNTKRPTIVEMLRALANNHKLTKEMNISGMKLHRRITWIRDMFTEEEIETQHDYISSGNNA